MIDPETKPPLFTTFVTAEELASVPLVAELGHEQPFRTIRKEGGFWGHGVNGNDEPVHLELIASSPDGRVQQMVDAGKTCDLCRNAQPTKEMAVTVRDKDNAPVAVVSYACNPCFNKAMFRERKRLKADARNNRFRKKLMSDGVKKTLPAQSRKKLKASRKARRSARKKSRL